MNEEDQDQQAPGTSGNPSVSIDFWDDDTPKPLEPYPDPELVFGLVGPVGVNLDPVVSALTEFLEGEGTYTVDTIRLSEEIADFFKLNFEGKPEHVRIRHLMHLGTELRRKSERGDAVSLLGVQAIQAARQERRDGKYRKHAYILRSLKTPDEIRTLRSIYGKGFFAIPVYTPRETRVAEAIAGYPESHVRCLNAD